MIGRGEMSNRYEKWVDSLLREADVQRLSAESFRAERDEAVARIEQLTIVNSSQASAIKTLRELLAQAELNELRETVANWHDAGMDPEQMAAVRVQLVEAERERDQLAVQVARLTGELRVAAGK